MKKLIPILIILFASCSKPQDYSYLNTDRRPQVIVTSKWYKNDNKWKLDNTTVHYFPPTVDYRSYLGMTRDTLPKNWKELIGVCPTVQIRIWSIKY